MPIDTLIDKQDTFEIVRDQIAAILAIETASQQALADQAGKDKDLWKIRPFLERSNPIEQWRDPDINSKDFDKSPIVNVRFDTGSFPRDRGDVVKSQIHNGTINIDCYGLGISCDNALEGHTPGDELAALEAQRAVRLVRNILMASEYTYLALQGTVEFRWIENITVFQPQIDSAPVQHVVGARISFTVKFAEFSPQYTPKTLELLTVQVKRTEDSQVVLQADYDYTT
jgi:hypothetical protein